MDYGKCIQTVTVYHREDDRYTQTVYENAFLDFRKTQNIDKTGSREGNSFLLVLPCSRQTVWAEGPRSPAGKIGRPFCLPRCPVWWWWGMWTSNTGRESWFIWKRGDRMKIQIKLKPVSRMIVGLGAAPNGPLQRQATQIISQRMTRYMPFRSGALATKLKMVTGPAEITVLGPYARYQYFGKVMAGAAPRRVTSRELGYDRSKNPQAGPFWDRRLMAAEGRQIAADLQSYIDRKAGRP